MVGDKAQKTEDRIRLQDGSLNFIQQSMKNQFLSRKLREFNFLCFRQLWHEHEGGIQQADRTQKLLHGWAVIPSSTGAMPERMVKAMCIIMNRFNVVGREDRKLCKTDPGEF